MTYITMNIPTKSLTFIWHFIKQQPIAFLIIFITCLIWPINEVGFPYCIKLIINVLAKETPNSETLWLNLFTPLFITVSLWLCMEVAMRLQGIVLAIAFPKFKANIRNTVFNYVLDHSQDYFANHFAGSIANKISDLAFSSERITEITFFNVISFGFMFFLAFIAMWKANSIFFVIQFTWFVVHMFFLFIFMNEKLNEDHANSVSTLSGKIVDALTNNLNIRLFARKKYELNYLKKYQQDEIDKSKRAAFHLEKMKFFQGLSGLGLIFSTVFSLIFYWKKQLISLGDISLVASLTFNMLGLVWWMSYQITIYVREIGKLNAALELISADHAIKSKPNAKKLIIHNSEICFDHVNFYYRKGIPIFHELSVTIPARKKVGLVGFSGSGKTTFVNLILRFYDIQSGKILIDDQSIQEVTQESLRQHIAVIPQDPLLFHRTLMENIRYGRLDATDEEVITASKLAYCDEFIMKLEDGYQTYVGERGVKLSGGQRQRVAIARAILKNAPILILDEATSSLDSQTEKHIQQSLHQLMNDRTTIVIAHRLSTLQDMNWILVFDQGKIIEQGTIEELLKKKGHFSKLWHLQQHGFLPDNMDEPEK